MSWLIVAISAYLILALANLMDKFLVTSVLKNSQAYAFVACILGSLVLLFAPWFLNWPGLGLWLWNLGNGFIFAIAIWLLYEALLHGEAARTLVFIGGMVPVFSLLFSLIFLKEQFTGPEWTGIIMILVGVFIIAALPAGRSYLARIFHKFRFYQEMVLEGLGTALLSALAYSLYFLSTKGAYAFQPFASAFIWTRVGASLFVLLFLFSRKTREAIVRTFHHHSPHQHKALVIFNQAFGSVGFILQNYAIFLGSVVLVNALQGVQYVFLLIISAILTALAPKLLKETFSWRIVLQKALAVIIIAVGLFFIAT